MSSKKTIWRRRPGARTTVRANATGLEPLLTADLPRSCQPGVEPTASPLRKDRHRRRRPAPRSPNRPRPAKLSTPPSCRVQDPQPEWQRSPGAYASPGCASRRCPLPWRRRNPPPVVPTRWVPRSCARPRSADHPAHRDGPLARSRPSGGGGVQQAAPRKSGGELGASLAATRSEDRAPCARAHTQPEAVGLGPTPVVRLKGPFGHVNLQRSRGSSPVAR